MQALLAYYSGLAHLPPFGGDVCLRVVVVYAGLLGVWEGRGVREKFFSKFSKQYLFGYYYETILAKYL